MEVFFATNRKIVRDGSRPPYFSERINATEPASFRVGTGTVVEQDGAWRLTDVQVERQRWSPAAPNPVLGTASLLPHLIDTLETGGTGRERAALVFLHGAAYGFADTLEDAALLASIYGTAGLELVPFVFSYPANGKWDPVNYLDDRYDASQSGIAMARAFQRFVEFLAKLGREGRCGSQVFLVAHSLGNYALRIALQQLIHNPFMGTVRLFSSVFLMAADDDNDALERTEKLKHLSRLTKEVNVYFREDDKLLQLADILYMDRLGQTGPVPVPPIWDDGTRWNLIDCAHIREPTDADTRHRYYKRAREVVEDMVAAMSGQAPEQIAHRRWDAVRNCWVLGDR